MNTLKTITNTRVFDTDATSIIHAFADPALLSRWWGPEGFTSTFEIFEFKTDGRWQFIMHAPDGTDYPNECIFKEVGPTRIIIEHIGPMHHFILTVTLHPQGAKTKLNWEMLFDTAEELITIRDFLHAANEQNLDRLERVLGLSSSK